MREVYIKIYSIYSLSLEHQASLNRKHFEHFCPIDYRKVSMVLKISRHIIGITGIVSKRLSGPHPLLDFKSVCNFPRELSTAPKMVVDLNKIGKNMVKKVPTMEQVPLESLWQDQTVVLTFLRRFGCLFCRQGAKEMSTLTPVLEKHGVKNIAVGLEDFGLDEFVDGKYFNGDLYVDIDKQSYKDIGYKRLGTIATLMSLVSKTARDRIAQNRQENLASNLKGDGYQTGGTLVITKGGSEVLLDYRQDNPADHVELSEILRVLNIEAP